MTKSLEVHAHSFVRGPRSGGHYERDGWHTGTFSHSHEGGDVPHEHQDCGPATYTIDKDEWARETGLRGGGRKKFTAKPSGEQMPIVEMEDWQKTFDVVYCDQPTGPQFDGMTGGGLGAAVRVKQTFRMHAVVRDQRRSS
jgi:hypothetical protein